MPRGRLIRGLAVVATIATASIGLAACASEPPAPSTPDGLAVSVQQGRLDVVDHRLVVRFENTGDAPVTIEDFEVVVPTFEPGLEYSKPFELTPDDALAIRLDLPASLCDAEAGPTLVDVTFQTEDGTGEGRLTADDPFDTVTRVNSADCLAESVGEVAEIVLPDHLRGAGTGAERRAFIDVELIPATSGDTSMRIERVYGTTLLNAEDGTDWTLGIDVAAGDAPFTISLPVRPARCDAHGIADDKRGTILPFDIVTSDGRAGRLDVPADDGLKAELYAYYGERCGLAAPPTG